MGTKVQSKSYMPGYYPMRDLNEDSISNSCSWSYGQYYNGFLPKVTNDAYPGYDKDSVKQKMLEHEAIFKNQVYELHRLYKVQRDMMDGVQRKELHRNRTQIETLLSPSPLASQIASEDARKWTNHSFPFANSIYAGPSVSGVNGINSPLSSAEGNNLLTGPYSSQNGCRLKDIEVFESRPSKVCRKTFDLQLPADEYIDTEEGEQMSVDKLAGNSSSYPRNCTMAHENGVNFYLDNGQKTDDRIDARLRSSNGFADLNEPIQLEDVKETNASPHNFCNGKIHDSDRSVKPNSQLLGFPNEMSLNLYGRNIDTKSNLHLHKNGNGSEWFSHVPEIGQRKSNYQFPHSFQQTQVSTSKVHQPTFYISDKSNGDFRKEETVFGVEISRRPRNLTNDGTLASLATSHITSLPQVSPPELAKPWPHSWEKPSGNFGQKPLSAQTHGALNADTFNRSSLASVQRDGISGDKWYLSTNATSKPPFAGDLPYRNGFYQGSSGSKEQPIQIPSSSTDFLRCSNENDKAQGHWTDNGLGQYCRTSNCVDMKSPKDMNLNVAISDPLSTQEMPVRGIEVLGAEKKHEDHLATLPWLRPKPACKNEVVEFEHTSKAGETSMFQNSLSQSRNLTDKAKDCSLHIAGSVKSSMSSEAQAKINEPNNCHSSKKLLGFPIFEKPNASENDSPSRSSRTVPFVKPLENKAVNKLNRILDINLPCDPTTPDLFQQSEESVVVDKVTDAKSASFRHHLDLNSCLSDDEPSAPITGVKIVTEIDLEAPAVAEAEEIVIAADESSPKPNEPPVTSPKSNNSEGQQDELITGAAEAIVAISAAIFHNLVDDSSRNPLETPQNKSAFAGPLTWFAEIVSSCEDDLQGKLDNEDDSAEEFDHFESMILRLSETREDDYMPAPLAPETSKQEESGLTMPMARPRKGQGRRGRQRRDFQRDILPGLASLSRHEVTEDLQLFGGLMRATGHAWQSGSARRSSARNGGGRGRRQVAVSPPTTLSCGPPPPLTMQMIKGVEVGLEDRSLTGWGKTTRRPRRQRCSVGNPTPIVLN